MIEIYDAVSQAQEAGLKAIRSGVSGKEVHSSVAQVFRESGFPETEGRGFTHSTGHGVGLDVHESPSLSEVGETLQTAQTSGNCRARPLLSSNRRCAAGGSGGGT